MNARFTRPSCSFVILIVGSFCAVLLASGLGDTASAARRGGYGRSWQSLAAARAYRAQAIASIQQQVGVARNVLASAESQAALSQATVSNALAQLSEAREQIDIAHDDVAQAAKTLRELEKEILADQAPNSELNIALALLQQAKDSMHDAMHRVFHLPRVAGQTDETARLTALEDLSVEQRRILAQDPNYQVALRDMQTAAAQVTRLRRELFLVDKQWVDARQELTDADKRSRAGTQQATTAGMSKLGGQQQLRSNLAIANSAREVIAQGEARLRQLGATTKPSSASTSNRMQKKK